LGEYAITVHGIKGSSRGICAEEVGAKAEALEHAAKDGNYDFVTAHNADFIEAAEVLIAALDDLLRKMAVENPKPRKDKPDSGALSRLLASCEAYDMDGVDAAMAEIEEYDYESDDGLAAWLRVNVDLMNFSQIREKLSAMAF
jgi:HPt (histidine-containing phosphotransfer) domain-containing protein